MQNKSSSKGETVTVVENKVEEGGKEIETTSQYDFSKLTTKEAEEFLESILKKKE